MAATEANYEAGIREGLERTGMIKPLEALGKELPLERLHTERTGLMAAHVIAQLGQNEQEAIRAGIVVTPHDIGKIDPLVQELVRRPGPLTAEEAVTVRVRHTSLGAGLLRDIRPARHDEDIVGHALNMALCHHLPPSTLLRLGDETIRIGQLVDRFDGMTDPTRPYRRARIISPEEALAIIRTDFEEVKALDSLAKFTVDCLQERYAD